MVLVILIYEQNEDVLKGYDEKHQTPEFAVSSKNEFKEDVPVDEFLSTDGLEDLKTGRRDFQEQGF